MPIETTLSICKSKTLLKFSMILNIANVGDNLDLMGEEWAEDHFNKMVMAMMAGPSKNLLLWLGFTFQNL